ncbi:MAG: helix-turn-helix domain-containing protein [Anaerolineales bacterium]|nr:helix-turn-helix domain-containing protein [Anaerolineales bacterium]
MWYNRSMRSFGELLTEYTQRAGITDAELARSIGVQRQTIFRWKEGLVARPRYREDVLKIAQKLRLTPAERDELLLASGFPPDEQGAIPREGGAPAGGDASGPATDVRETDGVAPVDLGLPSLSNGAPADLPRAPRSRTGWLLGGALLVASVAIGIGVVWLPRLLPGRVTATPTSVLVTPVSLPTHTPTVTPPTATPIVAQAGEKLVLVAPFVGYTSSELRFNVAGRIQETLDSEIADLKLADARVVVLDAPITSQGQAELTLRDSGASALIWGEYDAGRVRANVSVSSHDDKAWVNPVDSPDKLPVIINEQVPDAVRLLALFALGRLYRDSGDHTRAASV